jgi:8-oxo-dGTP diphosphatase
MTETEVVIAGLVTKQGKMLAVKADQGEGHPVSGQWHLPGGHIEPDEGVDEPPEREIKEELGVEVEPHQVVEAHNDQEAGLVRILIHASTSGAVEAKDSVEELKWIEASKYSDLIGKRQKDLYENSERIQKYVEKLEGMSASE